MAPTCTAGSLRLTRSSSRFWVRMFGIAAPSDSPRLPVPFPPISTPVSARAAAIAVLRDSSRRMTPLHRSLHVSASVATGTSLQRVASLHRCIVAWLYISPFISPFDWPGELTDLRSEISSAQWHAHGDDGAPSSSLHDSAREEKAYAAPIVIEPCHVCAGASRACGCRMCGRIGRTPATSAPGLVAAALTFGSRLERSPAAPFAPALR
jgi:hypothetical protein